MDIVPYPGAVRKIQTKRERKAEKKAAKKAKALAKAEKKSKRIVRGKVLCTCGELAKNFTIIPRYHDESCIINKRLKENKDVV